MQEEEKPSFEDAIERLEEIVASMEEGDTPLAQLVDQFEEGTRMAKACNERLKQAQSRIALVQQGQEGIELEEISDPED